MITVLIFGFGFSYATRHIYPLFGLTLLALLIIIRITPAVTRLFANFMLAVWGCVIIGSVVYALVARHACCSCRSRRRSTRCWQAWERRFSCGPAYIIGNDRCVRLIAINYCMPMLGLAFDDTARPDWMDKSRMAQLCAILVAVPEYAVQPELAPWFKGRALETLTLPYRRTRRTTTHDYVYHFIAPEACPAAVNCIGTRAKLCMSLCTRHRSREAFRSPRFAVFPSRNVRERSADRRSGACEAPFAGQ